ncbi:MAG: hypothetical protein ACLR4C_08190 [Eubacterium ventriosum]
MSVYSYMANNKKNGELFIAILTLPKKKTDTEKRLQHKREAEFWLENKKKAENGQLNMTFGSFMKSTKETRRQG